MAVTILEIARRLNISHTTVSRVLNNKPNVFVSEETRKLVQRAAKEMGYLPNLAARSLRDSCTNVIAVFGSVSTGLWGGITPEIIRGLSHVLHVRNYGMFLALGEVDDQNERAISSWRFDGAIVLQSPTEPTLRRLSKVGQPFVCVNEQIAGRSAVLCDEENSTRLALEHLWELGHRRIAYANVGTWHMPHYSVTERHDTYLAFLAQQGEAPIAGHDVREDDRDAFVREAVSTHKATAILAYDHVIATRIMSTAYKLGLRIPQDFSLICFNDEFPVEELHPALTVVAPEGEEMGREGGDLLLEQLATPKQEAPTIIRLPARLIVRGSTARPGGTP